MAARCPGVLAAMVALCGASALAQKAPGGWTPIGLSGGGAMFTPAISPADPRVMMLNCDMSAAYVTVDGGRAWRMIHHGQLRSNTQCRPAFHPTDAKTVYAANGWTGLAVSHDSGVHWQPIGNLPGAPEGQIVIDSGDPRQMLCGAGGAVYRSADAGVTWLKCDGPAGRLLALHLDSASDPGRRYAYAATDAGVWRSDDGGQTWQARRAGLPDGAAIQAFACASNVLHSTMLYCAVPTQVVDGKVVGALYRSSDRGETWHSALGPGLNLETKPFDPWAMGPVVQYVRLAASDANPMRVYAFNTSTGVPPPHHASAYRSDDGGRTWRATFQADPRFPGCNVEADYTVVQDGQFYQDVPGVAICAADENRLVLTDGGRCYVTADGGTTWRAAHTLRAPAPDPAGFGPRWLCNGLVVTTTWNYYIDPFEPQRHYIAYTDIGFARSPDAGKTWEWWAAKGRAPWANTCYELAFDPKTPGKVWGAFSNVHDIPNDNIISGRHGSSGPGGVCVSTDFAATWTPSSQGLPAAATTGVVLDPRSPTDARVLYAGQFGNGVYKSVDGGRTWTARNAGLGSEQNRRVCRVALHRDGTLFALVTALRRNGQFTADGVGLYRSTDGADHWSLVNASQPLLWPKDFTADPRDSRILYIGAADARDQQQGGLWRTTDGGATWKRIARQGPEHFGAYLPPGHRGWIYATLTEGAPGAGLWLSKDDGATWKPVEGLPFANAQRVTFDPADPKTVYVTTFGGSVWKGPAQ